jgi:hypothetical protein
VGVLSAGIPPQDLSVDEELQTGLDDRLDTYNNIRPTKARRTVAGHQRNH